MNQFEEFATTPVWMRYAFYIKDEKRPDGRRLIETANNPHFNSNRIKYWRSRGHEIIVVDREREKEHIGS